MLCEWVYDGYNVPSPTQAIEFEAPQNVQTGSGLADLRSAAERFVIRSEKFGMRSYIPSSTYAQSRHQSCRALDQNVNERMAVRRGLGDEAQNLERKWLFACDCATLCEVAI